MSTTATHSGGGVGADQATGSAVLPTSPDTSQGAPGAASAGSEGKTTAAGSNEEAKMAERSAEQQTRRRSSTVPGCGVGSSARPSLNVTAAMPLSPDSLNGPPDPYEGRTMYDYQVLDCNHELYDLTQHRGDIVLICNVASKDKEYSEKGYKMLSQLHNKFRSSGLVILAFPCNQFGSAEPGNEEDIAENVPCLYSDIASVDFAIMAKVDVNGDHELPLYGFLKSRIKGTVGQSAIMWNFTTFLVSREGLPVYRFAPGSTLEEVEPRVAEALYGTAASPPSAPPERAPTREPSGVDLGSSAQSPPTQPPLYHSDPGSSPMKSSSSSSGVVQRTETQRDSLSPDNEEPQARGA